MTEAKAREALLQLVNAATDGDSELIASLNLPKALEQLVGKAAAHLSVGELEAQYPLYCKAMRILVRDGVTIPKARRTVQYRDPEQLYLHLKRDQLTAASSC